MSDDPAIPNGMHWLIRRNLIERLRIPWEGMGEMANQQRAEAAAAIETLLDEIIVWQDRYAKMMIERLNAEDQRDEARREVCSMNETGLRMNESDKKREAKRRGWDCFKEKP